MIGRRALPRKPLCLNRDDEFREVRRLRDAAAAADDPLLLAVSGGNGVGKTTILVSLAYQHSDDYDDVLFYESGTPDPHTATTAADIALSLLVQLGVAYQEIPPPELRPSLLRSMLARRSVLIALDDIRSAEQVLPLLGDLGNAAVMVAGERHLRRLELARFESLKLQGFKAEHGVDYLTRIAGPVAESADPSALDRLVRLVGRVPLLLAAVASRLADGDESVEEYVDRLERATLAEVSDELSIDGEPVATTVCEAGYEGLGPMAATAYRWLSWSPSGKFDIELAAAVLEIPVAAAKRAVRALVERSLLLARSDEIFEYPEVMRKHANDKSVHVDRDPDAREIESRTVRLLATRAAALAKSLSDRPIPATAPAAFFRDTPRRYSDDRGAEQASAEFATGWTVFTAAARRATQLGMELEALVLWTALFPFGYQTFRTSVLIDGYRSLVDEAAPDWEILRDTATRWQLLRDIGALYEKRGEPVEGSEYIHRAMALDYPPGTPSILEWQALQCEGRGLRLDALDLLEQARAAVPLIGDQQQEARSSALNDMHRGRNLAALGRRDDAVPFLLAAENYFQATPRDANNAARCRVLLGDIAEQRDDLAEAESRWEAAAAVLTRYGMNRTAADVHDKLAHLTERQGRAEDAERHRRRAMQLRDER
ncbi:hypothetical protein [Nocardia cyriacigeorgica]|uniref:hypothetical protein n=1 Tax=Nocardia cyriacigeorgica TaxID=135487 RepID=UPI002457D89E|nr:hypothetical protein [Nocardia cyriacigeorgica]